jgi:ABC-type lipoprotein export system ATPase subunit
MLTHISIKNFKRFGSVDIPLGETVVFIGPNNSGKTTALQALALWDTGLRRWNEKYKGKPAPEKRPGITINRRDLIAIPIPKANLLWRDLHVRDVQRENGSPQTKNIRIDIVVDGVTNGIAWKCGLEFDYANEESLYCRPLRLTDDKNPERMPIPEQASYAKVAFLPPMSGLAAVEPKWEMGRINVLIGEGQTAQVLRNLCYIIWQDQPDNWDKIKRLVNTLFGVELESPDYIIERGEITMDYRERSGIQLALAASGRGLQQTLLLLAYLYTNPSSVLLLDEPDAHLEILRQRQIYQVLTDVSREVGSQIIAASHSEVILNEAADRDIVVAFVGKPHRIDDRSAHTQVAKALKDIGFEQFYQAEQLGWVLYLEGSTDLSILRALAHTLHHPVADALDKPFVYYVGNQPASAQKHFFGLREAKKDLVGIGIYDSDAKLSSNHPNLQEYQWKRREIENYLCFPDVLIRFARSSAEQDTVGPLFLMADSHDRESIMSKVIADLVPPVALRNPEDRWWMNVKASDEFLDRVFDSFYQQLGLPNLMRKTDYHVLAHLIRPEEISPDIVDALNLIYKMQNQANPLDEQ